MVETLNIREEIKKELCVMSSINRHAVDRITVLWAITECGLGGFFHAIQSPFTGLLVGGLSVTYISLIAWNSIEENAGRTIQIARSIAKAAVTVIIAKAIISPHSPVGAYLAVSIQAILGIVIYSLLPSFKISAILLGITSTTASALQKVFVLWIVFGQSFFESIDQFSNSISERLTDTPLGFSISYASALAFVAIYAAGGLFIGIIIAQIPKALLTHRERLAVLLSEFNGEQNTQQPKRSKIWIVAVVLGLFLLALAFQFFFVSADAALTQLIRTISIIAVWFIIIQPSIQWFIRLYAKRKSLETESFLNSIKSEIPLYVSLSRFAWNQSSRVEGNRIRSFILILLHFTLNER